MWICSGSLEAVVLTKGQDVKGMSLLPSWKLEKLTLTGELTGVGAAMPGFISCVLVART